MTISYPLYLPGSVNDIAEMTLTEHSQTLRSRSPFTRSQQVATLPAQWWECTVELNPLVRAEAEPWLAFLLSLRGGYGTFFMGDLAATVPLGEAGGSPKIAVDSLNAGVLEIYDATSSADNWLMAGDYLQIGDRMYRNLQNISTTSGGMATLDIWPDLRSSPSSGDVISVNSTGTLWRLSEDSVSRLVVAPGIYHIAFTAEESL
jgi:hypothetical protein